MMQAYITSHISTAMIRIGKNTPPTYICMPSRPQNLKEKANMQLKMHFFLKLCIHIGVVWLSNASLLLKLYLQTMLLTNAAGLTTCLKSRLTLYIFLDQLYFYRLSFFLTRCYDRNRYPSKMSRWVLVCCLSSKNIWNDASFS